MSSLIGRVRLHLNSAEGRLVNRLDRETSGIVVIAKSAGVAGELGRLFSMPAVVKRYWAIVHGHVKLPAVTIDAPLGKDETSAVAIKDCARSDGAAAQTDIAVVSTFTRDSQPFSWLDVTPRSGRKHQIRIHLAHIGHPVVGDKIYGRDEQIYLRFVSGTMTEHDRRLLMLPHHALHARSVRFGWRGADWVFEAAPGPALRAWMT